MLGFSQFVGLVALVVGLVSVLATTPAPSPASTIAPTPSPSPSPIPTPSPTCPPDACQALSQPGCVFDSDLDGCFCGQTLCTDAQGGTCSGSAYGDCGGPATNDRTHICQANDLCCARSCGDCDNIAYADGYDGRTNCDCGSSGCTGGDMCYQHADAVGGLNPDGCFGNWVCGLGNTCQCTPNCGGTPTKCGTDGCEEQCAAGPDRDSACGGPDTGTCLDANSPSPTPCADQLMDECECCTRVCPAGECGRDNCGGRCGVDAADKEDMGLGADAGCNGNDRCLDDTVANAFNTGECSDPFADDCSCCSPTCAADACGFDGCNGRCSRSGVSINPFHTEAQTSADEACGGGNWKCLDRDADQDCPDPTSHDCQCCQRDCNADSCGTDDCRGRCAASSVSNWDPFGALAANTQSTGVPACGGGDWTCLKDSDSTQCTDPDNTDCSCCERDCNANECGFDGCDGKCPGRATALDPLDTTMTPDEACQAGGGARWVCREDGVNGGASACDPTSEQCSCCQYTCNAVGTTGGDCGRDGCGGRCGAAGRFTSQGAESASSTCPNGNVCINDNNANTEVTNPFTQAGTCCEPSCNTDESQENYSCGSDGCNGRCGNNLANPFVPESTTSMQDVCGAGRECRLVGNENTACSDPFSEECFCKCTEPCPQDDGSVADAPTGEHCGFGCGSMQIPCGAETSPGVRGGECRLRVTGSGPDPWVCRGPVSGTRDGTESNYPQKHYCTCDDNMCVGDDTGRGSNQDWDCGNDDCGVDCGDNGGQCPGQPGQIGTTNDWTCPLSNECFCEPDSCGTTQECGQNLCGNEEWIDDVSGDPSVCNQLNGVHQSGGTCITNPLWQCGPSVDRSQGCRAIDPDLEWQCNTAPSPAPQSDWGVCDCVEDCAGRNCGLDSCFIHSDNGNGATLGFCPPYYDDCGDAAGQAGYEDDSREFLECLNGLCTCIPDCERKGYQHECGDDGCGGSCGSCLTNEMCDEGTADDTRLCVCDMTQACPTDDVTGFGFCGTNACPREHNVVPAERNPPWPNYCGTDFACPIQQGEFLFCQEETNLCNVSCTPLPCGGRECGARGCAVEPGEFGWCADGSPTTEVTESGCPRDGQPTYNSECIDGVCSCTPDCAGKNCGSDGCGGFCGDNMGGCGTAAQAALGQPDPVCLFGQCTCVPWCSLVRPCGDDFCGGSCGDCGANSTCGLNDQGQPPFQCTCQPQCQGKVCGDDGCNGTCASCAENAIPPYFCNAEGSQCVCTPDCSRATNECGPTGCLVNGQLDVNDTCGNGCVAPDTGEVFQCQTLPGFYRTRCSCPYTCDAAWPCGNPGCTGGLDRCGTCDENFECQNLGDINNRDFACVQVVFPATTTVVDDTGPTPTPQAQYFCADYDCGEGMKRAGVSAMECGGIPCEFAQCCEETCASVAFDCGSADPISSLLSKRTLCSVAGCSFDDCCLPTFVPPTDPNATQQPPPVYTCGNTNYTCPTGWSEPAASAADERCLSAQCAQEECCVQRCTGFTCASPATAIGGSATCLGFCDEQDCCQPPDCAGYVCSGNFVDAVIESECSLIQGCTNGACCDRVIAPPPPTPAPGPASTAVPCTFAGVLSLSACTDCANCTTANSELCDQLDCVADCCQELCDDWPQSCVSECPNQCSGPPTGPPSGGQKDSQGVGNKKNDGDGGSTAAVVVVVLLLLLLIAAGVGAAVWFFVIRDTDEGTLNEMQPMSSMDAGPMDDGQYANFADVTGGGADPGDQYANFSAVTGPEGADNYANFSQVTGTDQAMEDQQYANFSAMTSPPADPAMQGGEQYASFSQMTDPNAPDEQYVQFSAAQ